MKCYRLTREAKLLLAFIGAMAVIFPLFFLALVGTVAVLGLMEQPDVVLFGVGLDIGVYLTCLVIALLVVKGIPAQFEECD